MDLNDFPPHLLVCIFSYLNLRDIICSVRQTCRTWYQLSFERTFWKTINVKQIRDSSFTSKTFKEMVKPVLECIESLHIDIKHLDIDILLSKKCHFPRLKHLYVSCSTQSYLEEDRVDPQYYRDVLQLKQCLPGIAEAYDLHTLHLVDNFGADSVMQGMNNFFPSLTNIQVTGCRNEVECEKFFRDHVSLQHVSLRGSVIGSETLSIILGELHDLRTLDLTNTRTSAFSFELLMDIELEDGTGHRINLHTLILDGTSCDDNIFISMIKGANNLKSISISNCSRITNIGAECLAKYCPCLEVVILNEDEFCKCNITAASLQVIAAGCTGLKVLKANYCSEINDAGIEAVAAHCPELEELEVAGCTALTDAPLVSIAKNCPKIRRMNLSHCVQLTSKCVNTLLHLSKHLVYLNLENCHRISNLNIVDDTNEEVEVMNTGATGTTQAYDLESNDESASKGDDILADKSDGLVSAEDNAAKLKRLEKHCHVRILSFSFCSTLSNMCLRQIARQCPDLQEVNLQGCSMVTNAGLKALIAGCKFLRILNVSGGSLFRNSRLTDEFLDTVTDHCKCLEELIIVRNYNITADAIFRVIQECPNIKQITVSGDKGYSFRRESLSHYAEKIKGKCLCIVMSVYVEIKIAKDLEYNQVQQLSENC